MRIKYRHSPRSIRQRRIPGHRGQLPFNKNPDRLLPNAGWWLTQRLEQTISGNWWGANFQIILDRLVARELVNFKLWTVPMELEAMRCIATGISPSTSQGDYMPFPSNLTSWAPFHHYPTRLYNFQISWSDTLFDVHDLYAFRKTPSLPEPDWREGSFRIYRLKVLLPMFVQKFHVCRHSTMMPI